MIMIIEKICQNVIGAEKVITEDIKMHQILVLLLYLEIEILEVFVVHESVSHSFESIWHFLWVEVHQHFKNIAPQRNYMDGSSYVIVIIAWGMT